MLSLYFSNLRNNDANSIIAAIGALRLAVLSISNVAVYTSASVASVVIFTKRCSMTIISVVLAFVDVNTVGRLGPVIGSSIFKAVFARAFERSFSIDTVFVGIARKHVDETFVDVDAFERVAAEFVNVTVIAAAFQIAFWVVRIVGESAVRAGTTGCVFANRMTKAPVAEETIFAFASK
jgi:hypothetical protein